MTDAFGISQRSIKEFGIFLKKLIICFDGPSEPEIKSELKERLGVNLSKIFYEIKNFSLESCPEKCIQKRKLFGKQNIIFQGKQSPLPLADILTDGVNLYNDLNQKAILELITNQIEIGNPTVGNEFMGAIKDVLEYLFISRTFLMKNVISDPKTITDYEDEFNLLDHESPTPPLQYEVESSTKTGNCHYCKEDKGKIIWIKSKGNIEAIRKLATDPSSYSEAKIISRAAKVNIIVGEPGKGKSVCLSHLEKTFKESNPLHWVQIINLSDLSSSFNSCSTDHFTKQENVEISISADKCLAFLTDDCLKLI